MSRPALEVADIFRDFGAAWRTANTGHVSLAQLKVMSAIENCRTAALGGHVARCEDCSYTTIAYNSCRNRHCPKCQGAAAREWMAARESELLPVPYFHVVFTLPSAIGDIAYQNKAVIYNLLFKVAAETMRTIAADPEHLGARIGITAVLHTWGSAMMHHPHVHMIVSGGGISRDGSRWVSCRRRFLLPVRVLSELFRGLMLEKLLAAHAAGKLQFFGSHAALTERKAFAAYLAPLRRRKWHVIARRQQPRFTSRGFLPWRLSDDGLGASRIIASGRHPKPFTIAEVRRRSCGNDQSHRCNRTDKSHASLPTKCGVTGGCGRNVFPPDN